MRTAAAVLVSLAACLVFATPLRATPPPAAALEQRTLGLAQLENERPVEAEATFRKLTSLVAGDPLPQADLAIALLRQQKNDAALAAIDAALRLAPKRGDLLAIRAEVLKWSGKVDDALAFYRQAAAASPDDVETQFSLYRHATTLKGAEADAGARFALEQLARLRPENVVVLLALGSQGIARGERDTASRAYLRVKELIWQAPSVAADTLGQLLAALEKGNLEAARVPALRVENVLKITPMFQQGQRELASGIQGVPVVRFASEPAPTAFASPAAVSFAAQRLGDGPGVAGGLVTGDFDGDQKPDLARIAGGRLEVRRAAKGFAAENGPALPAGAGQLLAADLDNDGKLDLLASAGRAIAVLQGDGQGRFSDATASFGLTAAKATAAVAFDYDIEGDLDLAVGGDGPLEIYRNNLQGPLEAVGKRALAAPPAAVRALVASDLDRDGDLDLALATAKGLVWLDNLRQGELRDRGAASGLAGPAAAALVAADLDNDGRPDLVAAGKGLSFFHNLGGRFAAWKLAQPVPATVELSAVVAFDADNDGRLDLAAAGNAGFWVLGQQADGSFRASAVTGAPAGAAALAAADLDGDGDLDLLASGKAGLFRLDNQAGKGNRWLAVRLRGLTTGNSKNNVLGLGSVLEVRAGAAYQFREATGDVTHFGLGSAAKADSLRVVWTNGVPQNRLQPAQNQLVVEEQLLKGSCPFLYAWNGHEVAMVTDLLWGAPLGLPVAPGAYAAADPHELVAVPGAAPRGGSYELRITEELWEAAFFDRVRLWVVDHPAATTVASSLKIVPGERVPVAVLGARELRPVAAAWDGQGQEVTAEVARRDDIYADGYEPSPYQGVARPWSFTFDLGTAPAAPIRLLLDGWIFPADASLNLAAAQRSDLPHLPPRLEVETSTGWQTLLASMGHPAGKTKTMVVDTPALPAGAHRLRITTSLWLGWDRIAWTLQRADDEPRVVATLAPDRAELAYRGFSALRRLGPNAPHSYDYAQVRTVSSWLPFPGRYTRYGDVRPLLAAADDLTVILAPGDELALGFDATGLPPLAPGWQRSVFLESTGWDKDADRNTYEAQQLEPLPFGAMSGYPYGPGESYPATPAHAAYRREWLSREVPPAAPNR